MTFQVSSPNFTLLLLLLLVIVEGFQGFKLAKQTLPLEPLL
jgi:hypothetical protein